MLRSFYTCVAIYVILCLVVGGLYPLLVTLVAQTAFPVQAGGSLLVVDGRVIGSSLIGQEFARPEYFWPRPSAASYDAASSSASNLGPTNPRLLADVTARARALGASRGSPVPIDLVTSSASGLDPHITPAAALYQVPRVAQARGLSPQMLEQLVATSIEERTFGLLGERRVNVLHLNRALDAASPVK